MNWSSRKTASAGFRPGIPIMNGPTIFLLIFGIPLLEAYILLRVGHLIGALPTIGLVIATAVIGSAMLRRQGVATLRRVQETMARGEMPATEMLEGAMLLVSGALLITPGFITDTLGFLCLIPPLRRYVSTRLLTRLMRSGNINIHMQPGAGQRPGNGESGKTIEGDYTRRDDRER